MPEIPVPAASSTVAYAGSSASIAAALTLTEWGVLIGIATALLTFIANAWHQYRRDRREEREHEARMRQLERDAEV